MNSGFARRNPKKMIVFKWKSKGRSAYCEVYPGEHSCSLHTKYLSLNVELLCTHEWTVSSFSAEEKWIEKERKNEERGKARKNEAKTPEKITFYNNYTTLRNSLYFHFHLLLPSLAHLLYLLSTYYLIITKIHSAEGPWGSQKVIVVITKIHSAEGPWGSLPNMKVLIKWYIIWYFHLNKLSQFPRKLFRLSNKKVNP